MALPTLDATFASSADLPRKQMLAKWLVSETGETFPSNALVSGMETFSGIDINGIYTYNGDSNGKPSYKITIPDTGDPENLRDFTLSWESVGIGEEIYDVWFLNGDTVGVGFAISFDDVFYPWGATSWEAFDAGAGSPVVTESPAPSPLSNYYSLPERYLWAKIAVAAGGPKTEADYISLPKNYAWSDIYNAVAGSSGNHTDWSENVALGHIAAAYRGDTGNPANLATYIDWPWRYKIASIISYLSPSISYNAVIVSGAGSPSINETYIEIGQYNGKPFYCYVGDNPELSSIVWNASASSIPNSWSIMGDGGDEFYYSTVDTEFPWRAAGWIINNGVEPVPTLTPTNV